MESTEGFTCTIDNQGRILLPSHIRRQLSLGPGTEVIVILRENLISIQTPEQALRTIQQRLAKLVPPGVSLAEELIRERRKEAARED